MRTITVERLDSDCALGDVAAIHAIEATIGEEAGGAGPGETVAEMAARIRASDAGVPRRHWLARDGTGTPVGAATVSWRPGGAARRLAGFGADVLPAGRRRGVGTRLLREVLAAAAGADRDLLQTWTREGGLGEPFLAAYGGRRGSVVRAMTLDVAGVDRGLLDTWVARAADRACGYSLMAWASPVPAGRRDQVVRVLAAMSTAPRDGLEADDVAPTVADLVADEHRGASAGIETLWVFARHDASDRLVGSTAISFRPQTDEAHQGDTVVEPDHRRRGLGRWMKAAMLRRVLEERPTARITTDVAASNAPMLAINEALGFRVVRANGIWQVPVGPARAAVEARLAERA
ncbi:MAG TPA: GNAT family N-acetyltransferase [Candidatus Dormibacteraeota bacterium]|nr:GNAT family N-acetyltransferase [Candidatus Dormibacteraeota bacterium]